MFVRKDVLPEIKKRIGEKMFREQSLSVWKGVFLSPGVCPLYQALHRSAQDPVQPFPE
jgi:hypothetical protein